MAIFHSLCPPSDLYYTAREANTYELERLMSHSKPTLSRSKFLSCDTLLKATTALALCVSGCSSDTPSEESVSGKKKIAYAPYQDAQLTHHSPSQVKANVSASQEAVQPAHGQLAYSGISPELPSTFTAPKIAQGAQGQSVTNPHEGSKLAAGWPGGPQGDNAKPAPAPAVKTPTSRPSSRPTAKPASMPSGHPSSQPQQPVAEKNYVYGEISLDPSLVGSVKQGSVLFVVVRRYVEGGKGMLIAATKQANITKDSFPLKYVVKQQDAMMGAPLVGKVTVSARVDQDGDAISKQPGDLIAEPGAPVMVGENPVKLTISKAL
jgi:hypothetical protein